MNEMVKNFYKLPDTVQEALICASKIPELTFCKMDKGIHPGTSDWISRVVNEYPIAAVEPEAFAWGVKLRSRLLMVFSADHDWEYREDLKAYDKVVAELNDKYGTIVLSSELAGNRTGYGLAAHLLVPFAQITKITYDENRNPVTTVDNVRERIDFMNKENRYGTL
jgi:hypothetical protein